MTTYYPTVCKAFLMRLPCCCQQMACLNILKMSK
jgi:hypothetical protein